MCARHLHRLARRGVAVLSFAIALFACDTGRAQSGKDDLQAFVKPYSGMRKIIRTKPLPVLVVLCESKDPWYHDRLMGFGSGADGRLYSLSITRDEIQDKNANERYPIPSDKAFQGPVTTLRSHDGELTSVFALGTDGVIYQNFTTRFEPRGQWSRPWASLPRNVKFSAACTGVNSPDGARASVFATAADGFLYTTYYKRGPGGGWQNWTKLQAGPRVQGVSTVLATPHQRDEVDLFVIGQDEHAHWCRCKVTEPASARWYPIPGTQRFLPGIGGAYDPTGKLISLYATGTDGKLYNTLLNRAVSDKWLPWRPLVSKSDFTSGPTIVNAPENDAAHVCALARDGSYYFVTYQRGPGSRWSEPVKLGVRTATRFATAPALIPEHTYKIPKELVRDRFFGPKKSVATYFSECSYGQFTISEAYTTDWFTLEDDGATRDVDESTFDFLHRADLVKKGATIIQQVERRTPFRFAKFDTNRDGKITEEELQVYWIYPGEGARHRGLPGLVRVPSLTQGVVLTGLPRSGTGAAAPQTLAHELSHAILKHDDLYPQLGGLSLMSFEGNFPHLDPFAKMLCGWVRPTIVKADGWYELRASEHFPDLLLVTTPAKGASEYFLVENRFPTGSHEERVPDQGLAIWRITAKYSGKEDWGRKTIDLIRPFIPSTKSGLQPDRYGFWDASDPRTGYDLHPNSRPTALLWQDGSSSDLAFYHMPRSGSTVKVFVDVPPLRSSPPPGPADKLQNVVIQIVNPATGRPVSTGKARIYDYGAKRWILGNDNIIDGSWPVRLTPGRYQVQAGTNTLASRTADFVVENRSITVKVIPGK